MLEPCGSMPCVSAFQAKRSASAFLAAGVASWVVSVPSNATPIVPELYPSACPAVTPFPLASSPVIVSSGLGDADDGLDVVCECRPL